MPAIFCAAGISLLQAAGGAQAGEPPQAGEAIDQIVVVAHKDERSIRDIAANVTVVSGASLKSELAASLDDFFRYVPGVDHQGAGTRFGAEGVNIRGIGGNRVAILVDGVPLSDQFDVGSFSNATRDFLDTGLIGNLEVLHGPASALYGSSAIGGVVAVTTPDPAAIAGAHGFGGDALATFRGSDKSVHGQASLALQSAAGGMLLGASRRSGHETDSAAAPSGIDTRDYKRQTALVKWVADDRRGNTWRASYIHQDSDTRSDMNSMLGQGRFRSTTALEGDDHYRMQVLNLAWEFGGPEGFIDAGVARAFAQSARIEQATLDERGNARTPVSIRRLFEFDQDIAGAELNLWKDIGGVAVSQRVGVGFEYRERRTEELRDGLSTNMESGLKTNVLLGESFPLRDFPISTTSEIAAYLEDTISFGNWTVIAAVRADRYELDPEQDAMYLEDYPFAEAVGLEESDWSPKLGVIFSPTPDIDIYAQYAHGFRAPPYADANIGLEIPFFNYRAIPNPDLESESSDGLDVGFRFVGVDAHAHLSLFRTRYEDFIESKVRVGVDPDSGRILFQSRNLRATTIEGVEAAYSLRFGGERRAFGVDAALYYARGVNDDTGEALNSVGPPQAVVTLRWLSPDERSEARVTTTLSRAWDERDETGGSLFKPPGYGVADLHLSHQVRPNVVVRAGLLNLADRTYWYWSDVRGLAPDDPNLPFLSRAGRTASLSLNVTW